MSVEKCFAIYFPLKSKTVCTIRTAKWATGIVGVTLAGYNLVYFFVVEWHFSKLYSRHICISNDDYHLTLDLVDSILYSFGPILLMFISNFAIAIKFTKAKRKNTPNNSTESTNQALSKSATRGTAMVVTVSVTFLLLTAPVGVDNALSHIIRLEKTPWYRAFMNLTQYLNHSINGVLYCIVGSRFRTELFQIFRRKNGQPNTFSVYSITTSVTGNAA